MFQKLFKLSEKKTSVKTEVLAGITTFLTMAYILGVNPGMLSSAGMDSNSVFLATAIASGVACILMGLLANYPIALSSGMGINAFFTYTCVIQYGFTYHEALATVFLSGLIFFIFSITGLRKTIINAIPSNLKFAIGAGIGFFIAFIGLGNAGIIVSNSATKVALGNLVNPTVLLSIFGIFVTVALIGKKIHAATFYGLLITAILGVVLGLIGVQGMPSIPTSIVSFNFSMPTAFAFIEGLKTVFTKPEAFMVIFTFLFIDFFDTAGTLVGVCNRIGLVDKNGDMENIDKALLADSVGTMVGAALGTSTITSFVESTAGVESGGRTGLTAITTGLLFFLAIFFMPLLAVVNAIPVGDAFLSPVTSPALIIVGILMSVQLKQIEWDKFEVAASAFITILLMILSYSIAVGIAAGFLFYTISSITSGKSKNISPIIYALDIVFIIYFIL